MTIKVGGKIPSVSLMQMKDGAPQPVKTGELFAGKKVVVFALPGAFTPTCSAKHLPGFVHHAAAIKSKGVDAIACVSVNDAFVMGAWGEQQGAGDKVMMLADGNGELTAARDTANKATADNAALREFLRQMQNTGASLASENARLRTALAVAGRAPAAATSQPTRPAPVTVAASAPAAPAPPAPPF